MHKWNEYRKCDSYFEDVQHMIYTPKYLLIPLKVDYKLEVPFSFVTPSPSIYALIISWLLI